MGLVPARLTLAESFVTLPRFRTPPSI